MLAGIKILGANFNGKRVDWLSLFMFQYVNQKMKIKHNNEKISGIIFTGSN